MATRVTSARVGGRAAELTELRAALGDAVAGRPTLAFVAGESGVGKTRLVTELERAAAADGVRVLSGDCVDLGEGELAYAPIVAALRPLARSSDPILHDLPSAAREALDGMLPGLSSAAGTREFTDEASGRRARLFEALLELLDRLAGASGLLLIIEDLHWADASTRAFLAYLAASLGREQLMVVATYRADELHRRHPLRPVLAELERSPRARRVEVAPFSQEELREQLTDILGDAPEEDLVRRLFARSEGNALYSEELLAAGLDGRGALPPTLREALITRIEKLALPTQDTLRLLAVGGRLEHAVLAEASPLDPPALREALRETVATQIVRIDVEGRYAFRHALLAEVVADDLLPGERAEAHLALARALASHTGPGAHAAAGIAHHYSQAGDQPAALQAGVTAAEAAEDVYAHGEAATLYERALELWDRVPDAERLTGRTRVDVLRAAAFCHTTNNDRMRAETLLEAAVAAVDENVDPRLKAAVLERLSRVQWKLDKPDLAAATRERALGLLEPGVPVKERAQIYATTAKEYMLSARYREALDTARLALAEAEACGALSPMIAARDALGVSLAWSGDLSGIGEVRAALNLALEHDLVITAMIGYVNLADVLVHLGRAGEALALVHEADEVAARHGHRARWLDLMHVEILLTTGEFARAAELIPEGRRPLSPDTYLNEAYRRATLALALGDHDEACALLDGAESAFERSREPQFIGTGAALRAELLRRGGDLDGARQAVEDGLDRIEFCSEDRARICWLSAVGVRVEADAALRARDLGDAEAERTALTLAEMLLARVEATVADNRPVEAAALVTARADAERAAGRATGDEAALWVAAEAAWAAIARPYDAAEARWREAGARLAGGDREGATAAAADARARATAMGAVWLAAEVDGFAARARLRLDGTPPAAADDEDPFGLTPRERQVLELLAAGNTNREIGQTLYMAEKTASVHVSRILGKLDVRTRTEAAAVAHRLGLI